MSKKRKGAFDDAETELDVDIPHRARATGFASAFSPKPAPMSHKSVWNTDIHAADQTTKRRSSRMLFKPNRPVAKAPKATVVDTQKIIVAATSASLPGETYDTQDVITAPESIGQQSRPPVYSANRYPRINLPFYCNEQHEISAYHTEELEERETLLESEWPEYCGEDFVEEDRGWNGRSEMGESYATKSDISVTDEEDQEDRDNENYDSANDSSENDYVNTADDEDQSREEMLLRLATSKIRNWKILVMEFSTRDRGDSIVNKDARKQRKRKGKQRKRQRSESLLTYASVMGGATSSGNATGNVPPSIATDSSVEAEEIEDEDVASEEAGTEEKEESTKLIEHQGMVGEGRAYKAQHDVHRQLFDHELLDDIYVPPVVTKEMARIAHEKEVKKAFVGEKCGKVCDVDGNFKFITNQNEMPTKLLEAGNEDVLIEAAFAFVKRRVHRMIEVNKGNGSLSQRSRMAMLTESMDDLLASFKECLSETGRVLIKALASGQGQFHSIFTPEAVDAIEGEDALHEQSKGGLYGNFAFNVENRIDWMYVGRAGVFSHRLEQHVVEMKSAPFDPRKEKRYTYQLAKFAKAAGLINKHKILLFSPSNSRHLMLFEPVMCALLGTFHLNRDYSLERADYGLPQLTYKGGNSTECLEADPKIVKFENFNQELLGLRALANSCRIQHVHRLFVLVNDEAKPEEKKEAEETVEAWKSQLYSAYKKYKEVALRKATSSAGSALMVAIFIADGRSWRN
ncbi:hypothetical protein CBS101457_005149 [Exobasidium rhododendri]|nr:hypothetical protein CBS101457_005149 [Exobasidium rhododendri]